MAAAKSKMDMASLRDALPESRVVGLCVGASQDPENIEGFTPSQQSALAKKMRKRRSGDALPDVQKDVITFDTMLKQMPGDVETLKFVVGKDGGKLTREAFMKLVKALIVKVPPKSVYMLYYAGHGSQDRGAFIMEDGKIYLSDIISVWRDRPGLRRGQKLVIVADSCFSGLMIRELKAIPKEERDVLNIGIQAACLHDEESSGGTFTKAFTMKQLENRNFHWQQEADDYYDGDASKVQHPCYYTTWKDSPKTATTGESDGFEFRFFERPKH
jgi:hypothetical protein